MDIKSFTLGYNAGASKSGGNVSQAELEAAIKKVVPEWALKDEPPKASDVGAEEAGAVSNHNADQSAHPYLSGRVATALDRISGHDTNIEKINTSVAERLKTADLAAKLDAYKAAQGLVSNTTSNLTNYYLKSEIYTKEEVAALISAIPKFEIKVVTSLPTSNISLTTVYLVKDTTEGGGMYTEYIYVNGAWEELGSQTVDLSGYITDEGLDNILKDYATLTNVAEQIVNALKPYATAEEMAEAIRVATVNLVTGSQVTTAINNALNAYYTSAQVDAKIQTEIANSLKNYLTAAKAAELYQPKGDYLTPTTGDQRYAAKQATETALTEHGDKITLLEEALANSMVEYAESVEWLNENGDKERTYYLPDGYEYRYYINKYVEIPYDANDGKGVLNNIPTNSTWGNTFDPTWHVAGIWVSPLVNIDPAKLAPAGNAYGSRVVVSGIDKLVPAYGSPKRPIWVWYYKRDGSQYMIKGGTDLSSVGTNGEIDTSGENGFTFHLKDTNIFNDDNWKNVYGVRIGLCISTADITKEDVKNLVVRIPGLDFKGNKDGWFSTGKLHSDDPAVQENANNIASLQERMTAAEEDLEQIASGVSTEPLFPKLGLIGDSLTNQTTQGWQELTVSMLGNPEWHKNAVTGSSVADYGDDRSENPSFVPFIDRYLNTPADCDCIVIMGGSNDATYQYNYELGTVGVLANNNFIGAYCTIIEGLFERNPATRIMLMTPPRLYTADRVLSTHIQKYVEATKEIAKYYGLPCLDLYETLGWNDKTAAWCSKNFAGDDPVHFSDAIGPRVGRMVANFIKQYY